jgi:DNA-binding XRE family transcriptional regulator
MSGRDSAIAANLRRLRAKHGLSIRRLADTIEASTQTIVNIEGGAGCHSATLERIADALGEPLEELVIEPVSEEAGVAVLERFRASEWYAVASPTPEEEHWIATEAVRWLGSETPPDKAILHLLLSHREMGR